MLEPEPGAVVGRGLLRIAHPPLDVIEVQELPFLGFGALNMYIVRIFVVISF